MVSTRARPDLTETTDFTSTVLPSCHISCLVTLTDAQISTDVRLIQSNDSTCVDGRAASFHSLMQRAAVLMQLLSPMIYRRPCQKTQLI